MRAQSPTLADAMLETTENASAAAIDIYALIRELYPICRSITGPGLRATLRRVGDLLPLEVTEVPSGTPVFDWSVPREWTIRDAYIKDASGRRIVDFRNQNLHVVNYSVPVRARMTLEELRPHLHGIPDRPDWIPYRTSYYKESWGFCLPQRQIDALEPGTYEVVIDSSLKDGSLSYGECLLPGRTSREVLIFTHCCHPSTCNDNLTGVALATILGRYIAARERYYSYRFLFAPATIGSITWLARNEESIGRIAHGLVIGLLGDRAPLTYKRSRRGSSGIDRAAEYVLKTHYPDARLRDFSPYGYDERQFCSPGINLPIGRLTRSSNAEYDEYHSSADDLDFISADALADSFLACLKIIAVLDSCRTYVNLSPKGEPRLGKYGLYGAVGGKGPNDFEYALLWVLNQSDGTADLLDIARRSGLAYDTLLAAARAAENAGLLRPSSPSSEAAVTAFPAPFY
jgi:aminopeptidase-like protein